MRTRLILILAANLVLAAPAALAQNGNMQWSGSVTAGARYIDDKADDPSKLDEYRSLGSGISVFGDFELRGRSDTGYLNAYGENFGRDNQYLDLRGAAYGVFKFRLFSDEMRHNLGSGPGALSPFSGIGSATLTAVTPPDNNFAGWNTFDHSYARRDKGGMVEWQGTSPWYVRIDTNEVKREGINVFAGARGNSPCCGFADLPSPIDYTTQNASAEFGYSSKRAHFAANVMRSTFSNGYDVLSWSNAYYANALDKTVLPPDNELTRVSINGNLRQLPWNSTLAGRLVFSRLQNNVAIEQSMLYTGGSGAFLASNATPGTFHGDVKRTNLSLSFSSHPTRALDTRAYVDYGKEDNDSTAMTFPGTALTGGACTAVSCSPHRYEYKRTKVGVEAGYRLSRANKLSGGLEFAEIERERIDFHNTDETRFFAQWKNSSLDALTARVKYQHLARRSDFVGDLAFWTANGNPIDFYVRRYDVANVNQNQIKLILDAVPARMVDLGFEAIFKDNDYKDTLLGRTNDRRQEFYASLGYGDPNAFRVLVFGDIETTKFESFHRVGTGASDPATPPAGSTYNWTGNNEDKAWQLGVGWDWKQSARLSIKGSLSFAKTEGSADFTPEAGVIPALVATPFQSITNVDNTKRTALNLKAVYAYDKQWELTGGYAYERYEYNDVAYTGTRYVAPDSNANEVSPVTGQYSFQPYKASIIYAAAKYKF